LLVDGRGVAAVVLIMEEVEDWLKDPRCRLCIR